MRRYSRQQRGTSALESAIIAVFLIGVIGVVIGVASLVEIRHRLDQAIDDALIYLPSGVLTVEGSGWEIADQSIRVDIENTARRIEERLGRLDLPSSYRITVESFRVRFEAHDGRFIDAELSHRVSRGSGSFAGVGADPVTLITTEAARTVSGRSASVRAIRLPVVDGHGGDPFLGTSVVFVVTGMVSYAGTHLGDLQEARGVAPVQVIQRMVWPRRLFRGEGL